MAQPQIRDDIGGQYDVSRIREDFPILSEARCAGYSRKYNNKRN